MRPKTKPPDSRGSRAVLLCAAVLLGCNGDLGGQRRGGAADQGLSWDQLDLGLALEAPSRGTVEIGPPFPFHGASSEVTDSAVQLDPHGRLTIASGAANGNIAWIANTQDFGIGTVSKLSTRSVREVGRYLSTTCHSLPSGDVTPCDGTAGCCSADDDARLAARLSHQQEPPHQAVPPARNFPSRTSVDASGDVYVANRGSGSLASITRIANDLGDCVDRNGNGRIDTSSDVNSDGLINTDCNGDLLPDDLATVAQTPCKNMLRQEFYGSDDECVLWTTTVGQGGVSAIAVAAAPAGSGGLSDAWVGTRDGAFRRVEGLSGRLLSSATLPPGCHPEGAVADGRGVLWVPSDVQAMPLCYLPLDKPGEAGAVPAPPLGPLMAETAAVDRDGNIWVSDGGAIPPTAWRYSPVRGGGSAALATGHWIKFEGLGGSLQVPATGVAVDARAANAFLVYVGYRGGLITIPASGFPPALADRRVDGSSFAVLPLPGFSITAVGVAADANVWAVSITPGAAIRCLAGGGGALPGCDVASPARVGTYCPAGDRCELRGPNLTDPVSDAYSDFLGGAPRGATRPRGTYSRIVAGCSAGKRTTWQQVIWDGSAPAGTSIALRARQGDSPRPDATWSPWTAASTSSPTELQGALGLQGPAGGFLQVEFTLAEPVFPSADPPTLTSAVVSFDCSP